VAKSIIYPKTEKNVFEKNLKRRLKVKRNISKEKLKPTKEKNLLRIYFGFLKEDLSDQQKVTFPTFTKKCRFPLFSYH